MIWDTWTTRIYILLAIGLGIENTFSGAHEIVTDRFQTNSDPYSDSAANIHNAHEQDNGNSVNIHDNSGQTELNGVGEFVEAAAQESRKSSNGESSGDEQSSRNSKAKSDEGEVSNLPTESVKVAVEGNSTNSTAKSGRSTKVSCLERNITDGEELSVQILSSNFMLPTTYFQNTPNLKVAPCFLALFYAPWCQFSALAAPHYNALPRLFPDLTCFAISATDFTSLIARFGTIAVPTLLLFHNGQPVARFNETQYSLENFVEFVKRYTDLTPQGIINVTSADFEGPLPSSPVQETDYLLWLAWIFLIACCCFGITKSDIWHRTMEILRNNWQEAEAQHEHAD